MREWPTYRLRGERGQQLLTLREHEVVGEVRTRSEEAFAGIRVCTAAPERARGRMRPGSDEQHTTPRAQKHRGSVEWTVTLVVRTGSPTPDLHNSPIHALPRGLAARMELTRSVVSEAMRAPQSPFPQSRRPTIFLQESAHSGTMRRRPTS